VVNQHQQGLDLVDVFAPSTLIALLDCLQPRKALQDLAICRQHDGATTSAVSASGGPIACERARALPYLPLGRARLVHACLDCCSLVQVGLLPACHNIAMQARFRLAGLSVPCTVQRGNHVKRL
jgi:hypothetical protein